jgi:hypothetical protein
MEELEIQWPAEVNIYVDKSYGKRNCNILKRSPSNINEA